MPAKVMVSHTDHTPGHLRELASKRRFRDCRHRLRAIALVIEDRLSRTAVASAAGVGVQTLRDWVVRYNADGLDGLRDAARPGAPPKLESGQATEVASWLEDGPDPDAGGPSRWTVADIRARTADSFGVGCTVEGARRLVRRLGFRHMSPRPVHPRADPAAREGFRSGFSRLARKAVPDGVAPEDVLVYFQGRGEGRAEGHALQGLGTEGDAPAHRAGPPVRIRVPVLRCLPRDRRRGRARVRQGQHRGDGPAPPRHRGAGPRREARPGGPRRGGLAPVERPRDTGQRLPAPAAALQPGAQPRGDGVLRPEAPALRQQGVRKRGARQGDRGAGVGRLHRPEGGGHADHHEGMGGAVISGAPIGDYLFGLV